MVLTPATKPPFKRQKGAKSEVAVVGQSGSYAHIAAQHKCLSFCASLEANLPSSARAAKHEHMHAHMRYFVCRRRPQNIRAVGEGTNGTFDSATPRSNVKNHLFVA